MPYELVSRTLAYVSCMTAMSLFATSMAIAAINVGKASATLACPQSQCAKAPVTVGHFGSGGSIDPAHIAALADVLWLKKS